jgi:ubiquitin C-terminal hydrolase
MCDRLFSRSSVEKVDVRCDVVKKLVTLVSKFQNFGQFRQFGPMATSSDSSGGSEANPAASVVPPPLPLPPPSPAALGWVSVKIAKQGKKKGLPPCHIGEKNQPTDLFLLLRAFSNHYTATKDRTRNLITIHRTFDTLDGPLTIDVFSLEFTGCFNTFELKMLDAKQTKELILDACCRTGPTPDFGVFPWSLYFVPTRAWAKNRDSAHPYNFVRRLFRAWLDDPVMAAHIPHLIRDFFFPRLSADRNNANINLEERRALPEFLRDLTGASVRIHWARPAADRLAQFGDDYLFSLTVVFPWAIDILVKYPNALSTDSTFHALEPYTLPILHAIIANESLPLAFAVSPTETRVAYGAIYDHVLDLGRSMACELMTRGLAARLLSLRSQRVASERAPSRARDTQGAEPAQIPAGDTDSAEPVQIPAGDTDRAEPGGGDDSEDIEGLEVERDAIAERDGKETWPDDPDSLIEEELAGEPPEAEIAGDVPEVDDSPMAPRRDQPLFDDLADLAIRLWNGTFLTALPLLTDQGTALESFVNERQLIWKICHRHIIEAIGANSLIGKWAARLLRCYSEAEWRRTRDVITYEMADPDMRGCFEHNGAAYESLLRLLQQGITRDDKHHLAKMERWALWLRPGVPRMTNSAESVNGHINADIDSSADFLARLTVVAMHLRRRYMSRNTWCDRALKRNAGKCWPSTENPSPFSGDRVRFYRLLHNAEALLGPVKRRFAPPNPLYLIAPSCTQNHVLCSLPAQWGLRRRSLQPPNTQSLTVQRGAAKTPKSSCAWQIALDLRSRIGAHNWATYGTQVFVNILAVAREFQIPETGPIPPPSEAKWHAQCWLRSRTWITAHGMADTNPPDAPADMNPPSADMHTTAEQPPRRGRRQQKSGTAGTRGTPLADPSSGDTVVSTSCAPSDRPELRGLVNLSGSCYINAVLQCLLHLPLFNSRFPDYQPGESDMAPQDVPRPPSRDGLAFAYWNLRCFMDIDARDQFYRALFKVARVFEYGGQHDAHECFLKIFEGLQSDLGQHPDLMKNIFVAWIQSNLRCNSCGCERDSNQSPILTISLPLAPAQKDTGDLTDCLNRFHSCATDGTCLHCRAKRMWKTDRFCMLPPVLVFHLKRFGHFSGPRGRKLDFHVPFPDELDMGPYATCASFYDLRSIVVHNGPLHNGHYVAYVRIADKWYCFDDALVFQSDPDAVCRQQAYLLFYERRG